MEQRYHHSYGYALEQLPQFHENQFELGHVPLPCNTMISRVGSSSSSSSAAAFYAAEACMGLPSSRYDLQENETRFSSFDQQVQQPVSYHHQTQTSRNTFIRPNSSLCRNDLSENDRLLILEEKLLGDVDGTNMIISPSPPFIPFQDFRVSLSKVNLIWSFPLLLLYLMMITCRPRRIMDRTSETWTSSNNNNHLIRVLMLLHQARRGSDGLQIYMIGLSIVWVDSVDRIVSDVQLYDLHVHIVFHWSTRWLMYSYSISRGEAEGDTAADGYRGAHYLSCQKPSSSTFFFTLFWLYVSTYPCPNISC